MKAAVRERYGPPDVVEIRDLPDPAVGDDGVRVRVVAASINRVDLDNLYARPAFTRLFLGVRRPRIRLLGSDVAGVVEAVGANVTRLSPGDRVFADLYAHGAGAFAEVVVAPERAFQPVPPSMTVEDAAMLPHAGTLAVQGLRRRDGRRPGPGSRVLIDGASGSVGPFAVQVAKALGAEVTGVASTAKLGLVQSVGADHVIDYTTTDYTTTGQRYDWILDVDSHHALSEVRRALRPGGTYVTLGGTGRRIVEALVVGPVASLATGKSFGLATWWRPMTAVDAETLAALHAEGKLHPVVDRTFALSELVEALRYVDAGKNRGKVLIVP